jgi:hypothetical protein
VFCETCSTRIQQLLLLFCPVDFSSVSVRAMFALLLDIFYLVLLSIWVVSNGGSELGSETGGLKV